MLDTPAQIQITCQRCGTAMELRDPLPDTEWKPNQYWVCPRCGRHFWSSYASPAPAEPKPAAR